MAQFAEKKVKFPSKEETLVPIVAALKLAVNQQ